MCVVNLGAVFLAGVAVATRSQGIPLVPVLLGVWVWTAILNRVDFVTSDTPLSIERVGARIRAAGVRYILPVGISLVSFSTNEVLVGTRKGWGPWRLRHYVVGDPDAILALRVILTGHDSDVLPE